MFEQLSERLAGAFQGLGGKARLNEEQVAAALREVRSALLDADVALSAVRAFTERVRERALGQTVGVGRNPLAGLQQVVHEELVALMGSANDGLNLATAPPAVVLMAGLQGVGKTTTAAKLALFVRQRLKRRVALVSADVYRPAAIDQLARLAEAAEVSFLPTSADESPAAIAERSLEEARRLLADVLIVDTAGRLAVDDAMMREISDLKARLSPAEILFVVDAMTGQDAALTAQAFNDALDFTGVILAKADGDARGGAALSVRQVTGKPIKFLGMGEKIEALEPFHPDRLASRILGMGDVLSLMEEAERKVDKGRARRLAGKLQRRERFDLADFRDQIRSMSEMGGLQNMLGKLPGMNPGAQAALAQAQDDQWRRALVMIDSMTPGERRFPDLIDASRRRRIARGSGQEPAAVNRVLKQYRQMAKAMKKAGRKGGMQRLMHSLQAAQGAAPGSGRHRRR